MSDTSRHPASPSALTGEAAHDHRQFVHAVFAGAVLVATLALWVLLAW